MGMYKYLKELMRNSDKTKPLMWERKIKWRKEPSVIRIEKPTNLVTARSQGYRAKKGIVLVRVRVKRGGKQRPDIKKGRRSKHGRQKLVLDKSYQWMAEERAAKKYPNMEVLNSYVVSKDGLFGWYEVILVDPKEPSIKSDKTLKWITSNKHTRRVFRGLTSAGKKSRGLMYKGKGAEKLRPSLKANKGRGK